MTKVLGVQNRYGTRLQDQVLGTSSYKQVVGETTRVQPSDVIGKHDSHQVTPSDLSIPLNER